MPRSRDLVALEFVMTPEQRTALHEEARKRGLVAQELLELKVFGELRPRMRPRRRAPRPQEELPIAG